MEIFLNYTNYEGTLKFVRFKSNCLKYITCYENQEGFFLKLKH